MCGRGSRRGTGRVQANHRPSSEVSTGLLRLVQGFRWSILTKKVCHLSPLSLAGSVSGTCRDEGGTRTGREVGRNCACAAVRLWTWLKRHSCQRLCTALKGCWQRAAPSCTCPCNPHLHQDLGKPNVRVAPEASGAGDHCAGNEHGRARRKNAWNPGALQHGSIAARCTRGRGSRSKAQMHQSDCCCQAWYPTTATLLRCLAGTLARCKDPHTHRGLKSVVSLRTCGSLKGKGDGHLGLHLAAAAASRDLARCVGCLDQRVGAGGALGVDGRIWAFLNDLQQRCAWGSNELFAMDTQGLRVCRLGQASFKLVVPQQAPQF